MERVARVRTLLGWGLPLFLGLSGYALFVAWSDAAPPRERELLDELERRFGAEETAGAPIADRLRAVAERWSFRAPHRVVRVRDWEFRLLLHRFDAAPGADERPVLRFVCFVENSSVETAWPNGVFYDWGVYARPSGPIARLRRRWS